MSTLIGKRGIQLVIDFEKIRSEVVKEVTDRAIKNALSLDTSLLKGFDAETREEMGRNELMMKFAIDAAEITVRKYHEQLLQHLRSLGIDLK